MKSRKTLLFFVLFVLLFSGQLLFCQNKRTDNNTDTKTVERYKNKIPDNETLLSFHLSSDTPQEGFIEIFDDKQNKPIYIDPEPVLTNKHLAETNVEFDKPTGRYSLIIHLTPEGGMILRDFSSKHVQEKLVIKFRKKVLIQAIIREAIGTPIRLEAGFTKEENSDLAKEITGHINNPEQLDS